MSEEVIEQRQVRYEVGSMVSDVRLPSVGGPMISPVDYKERKNLAILIFDIERSEDYGALWELARRYKQFEEEETQLLGMTIASKAEAEICIGDFKLPFPVLYNEALVKQGPHPESPMLLVADRFGEIQSIDELNSDNIDDVLDRAIDRLDLLELECPECGAPTWAI
jgi:peroxiredoxin